MALALLRLDDSDERQLVLDVDTGTSPYYRIHLGKEVRRDQGFILIDQVTWSSPVRRNPSAGRHLDTRTRYALDPGLVTERDLLVQLQTMRAPDGRGPAWSRPVRVPRLLGAVGSMSTPLSGRQLLVPSYDGQRSLPPMRGLPVRSARETFSRPASLEDILGAVVQVAGPVVQQLLSRPGAPAGTTPAAPGAAPGTAPGAAAAPGTDPTAAAIAALLRTVLGALSGSGTPLATTTSLEANRLRGPLAEPFIAPALLALAGPVLSAVAGPLVQALPQLLNAANQHKLESRRESHQHIADILAQVDRSRLLEQLIAARTAPPAPGSAPADAQPGAEPALSEADLTTLLQLLQAGATTAAPTGTPATAGATTGPAPAPAPASAAPAAAPAPASAAPALAHPSSTGASATASTRPARPSRAVLAFVTGAPVDRLGRPTVVFDRRRPPTLRYRLEVGAQGPATSLPRAVLDLVVREPGGAVDLVRRSERLTAVRPGEVRSLTLTEAEAAALPADTDLEVIGALRWPGSKGSWQATAAQRMVLGRPQQVVGTGAPAGDRRELTDMTRFRSFWNKVWSSPVADAAGKGPMWGLDVALRYSVVATARPTNGLMESRLRADPPADESVRVTATGRMKSGVELSVAELNELLALWPGEQRLDAETLAAFTAPAFLAGQGGDAVHRVRLEGRRGTSGLVWVVPVPTLRTFTVATTRQVDAFGQVVDTEQREVRFPVVEAVRILGLVSQGDEAEGGDDAAGYRFTGFDVSLDELVALEPAVPMPAVPAAPAPAAPAPAATAGGA